MPNLFDIDYDQQAKDLLPPDKRDPETLAGMKSYFKAIQWARDLVLGGIKTGATAAAYAPGTYNIYDQVLFEKAVYESLIDSNTDAPTVATSWTLIQPNFIGVDERIKYNAQNIVLEWALNREFNGVFRQPVTAVLSDIYLTRTAAMLVGFRIGADESGTGVSSIGQTTASDSIGGPYPFVQVTNFDIKIKAALYALTNDSAIRNFVNKYIPKSLNYTITPY